VLRIFRLHRLATTFLAAFAFSASRVEVLLPELHDGDGETQVTATAMPAPDCWEAPHSAHAAAPHSGPTAPEAPHQNHGPHVDHCGHSHSGIGSAVTPPRVARVHQRVPQATASTLDSVELPLSLRPPII